MKKTSLHTSGGAILSQPAALRYSLRVLLPAAQQQPAPLPVHRHAGSQLGQIVAGAHFWFAWAAFQPETAVYGLETQ
ncbi:MAG: hypothetical protein ACUVSX_02030 [Aggregatilineales bacterium]